MKLAVAVIHGMGSQKHSGFADGCIAEVSDRLRRAGHAPDEIAWQPIFWADVLSDRQQGYLQAVGEQGFDLDWMQLRQFIVVALGDAGAYQFVDEPTGPYVEIHDRVRDRLSELYVDKLASTPVPLVVMAHSLGSHIISSYIWDTQRGKDTGAGPGASTFERFEHLAGLITFGSNIPLFTFAHEPVEAISFPGSGLSEEQAAKARWLNFYDKDDVLGYPLQPTSDSYREVVDEDIQIDVGLPGISALPFCHGSYWTDNDFTRPAAEFLARFL